MSVLSVFGPQAGLNPVPKSLNTVVSWQEVLFLGEPYGISLVDLPRRRSRDRLRSQVLNFPRSHTGLPSLSTGRQLVPITGLRANPSGALPPAGRIPTPALFDRPPFKGRSTWGGGWGLLARSSLVRRACKQGRPCRSGPPPLFASQSLEPRASPTPT